MWVDLFQRYGTFENSVYNLQCLVVKTRKYGEKREAHKEACVDQISYMKSIQGKQQKAVKALEQPKTQTEKYIFKSISKLVK